MHLALLGNPSCFTFHSAVEKYVRIPLLQPCRCLCFGLLAQAWACYLGFNSTADLIIAGSVMPFVPGIALTNAVRTS